ncbi:hypothetical protein [Halobacillus seohaensis]
MGISVGILRNDSAGSPTLLVHYGGSLAFFRTFFTDYHPINAMGEPYTT